MQNAFKIYLTLFFCWFVLSIKAEPVLPNETVMTNGMKITVTSNEGTISILAGTNFERSYTWDGATRSVVLWPRKHPWNGSLGIYYPGPGEHWANNHGITRGVLQEGQQHFKNLGEFLDWLHALKGMQYVYQDNGLVVGWKKTVARKELTVDVWQIYIDGQKPKELPGSENDKIIIEGLKGS